MILKPQEERAIRLALPILDSAWGAAWLMSAAIEVKQLMGDAATREYTTSRSSLFRRLVPAYGGRYSLWPCYGFNPPVSLQLFRKLRDEIQRVGKTIPPGGEGAIRIPRSAEMTCISKSEGPFINCWHVSRTDEPVREISAYVSGIYHFNDGDRANRWHHSFITDGARREFQARLIDACHRSAKGHPVVVDWQEEWKLTRSATSKKNGVHVLAMHVGWAEPGLREELQEALDKAGTKFWRRWAEHHVIILERNWFSNAIEEDVKRLLPELNLPTNVDLILLVDGDRVTPLAG